MDKANVQKKKQLTGVVTGNKMQGTVKVAIERQVKHERYSKIISRKKTFFAHTDKEIEVGTKVVIQQSRPRAKNVNWVVVDVVEA